MITITLTIKEDKKDKTVKVIKKRTEGKTKTEFENITAINLDNKIHELLENFDK